MSFLHVAVAFLGVYPRHLTHGDGVRVNPSARAVGKAGWRRPGWSKRAGLATFPAVRKDQIGWLGALWGIGGVVAILLFAVVRLAPIAVEALRGPLGLLEWSAVVVSLVFFAYTEGFKAFQKQFSPRVVVRAMSLVERPDFVRVLLAPLFSMGFFGATRKRMIVSWVLTAAIIVLIRLVGALSQPWRGIIDLGVVVALLWGVFAILAFAAQALSGKLPAVSADLPSSPEPV